MPLATLENLSIRFRGPALLDDVSSVIEPGQRIGLLGRNGAGKTTLLKMLNGDLLPDTGRIIMAPGTRIARLIQDVPADLTGTVTEIVSRGLADLAEEQPWEAEHRVETTLAKMELDGSVQFQTLSSGLKRRVLLAAAIATQPQMLLLDEPTNHLDIESILWLEGFLSRWNGTLMFITHDRSFLQKLANRIWEIDRGRLFDWSCDYNTFLKRKEEALDAEEKQNALFDKKLAQEEVWIRQGIKARRTRNEGRVRALKKLREERQERRKVEGSAKLMLQDAARSGALVAELKDVSFSRGERPIIKSFSTTIMRGDKVGIIGRNGAGKTTLLRLMLGQLEPDSGSLRLGTNLQVAYFDQLRDQLDENKSVQDNVADGNDRVQIGGATKHVIGYLQDFLFTPERARTEVRFLSGGERNRVLLAKLMTRPANVIVLDEPTNDLDSETLDLLEEQLVSFGGTLLIVSHDRTFLNNVVTSTIVFEEDGVNEYVGGYDNWRETVARRQSGSLVDKGKATDRAAGNSHSGSSNGGSLARADGTTRSANGTPSAAKSRLNYKEQKELDSAPGHIEQLEAAIGKLHSAMADTNYYRRPAHEITADQQRLGELEAQLATTYARWEELEARR